MAHETILRYSDELVESPELEHVSVFDWGLLPQLSVLMAVGLLLTTIASYAGRLNLPWAINCFWPGLIIIFIPVVMRLLQPDVETHERVSLVVLLGSMLFLVKVLQYPLAFATNDEYQHQRTLNDVFSNTHLFTFNPLLPISPIFPGLEIVTTALAHLSRLPLFVCANIIVGTMRVILMLGLFQLYTKISGSPRLAAIGVLLYMANPLFLLFDVQFAYESMAVPLTVMILGLVARVTITPCENRTRWLLLTLLSIGALTVIHHLTSYVFLSILFLWLTLSLIFRRDKNTLRLLLITVFSLVVIVLWLKTMGSIVVSYLGPYPAQSFEQTAQVLMGHAPPRAPFSQVKNQVIPEWEHYAAFLATILVMASLPFGFVQIFWKQRRSLPALLLMGAAMLYPISMMLRLTSAGEFAASRIEGYAFIPLPYLIASGTLLFLKLFHLGEKGTHRMNHVFRMLFPPRSTLVSGTLILSSLITLLFVGGVVLAVGQVWAQIPGSYVVGDDGRSLSVEGVQAAKWVDTAMGSQVHLASDRTNQLLMGTYGQAQVATVLGYHTQVAPIFTSPSIGLPERAMIYLGQVRYLVVDRRMSESLPAVGYYFEQTEPQALHYDAPIDGDALAKFDYMPGVSRLFDSGNIIIYDLGGYSG